METKTVNLWLWVGLIIHIAVLGLWGKVDLTQVFSFTNLETSTINLTRSFYPHQILGRGLENKGGVLLNRLGERLFESIDVNRFFFASHPRERGGVIEFEMFPFWLLPLFLLGMFNIKLKYWLVAIFAVGVLGPRQGSVIWVMVWPVGLAIVWGIKLVWSKTKPG